METEFKGIRIVLNNNKSRLLGNRQIIEWLKDETKIKHPKAFWSQAKRSGRWDGYIRFITESTDMFPTGMLPQILELLKKKKVKVMLTEQRDNLITYKIPKKLGDLTLRGYQFESVIALLQNALYDSPFPRGILYEATNAGKNLIAAAIVNAFKNQKALFLINNTEIFVQALEELEALLPGTVGQISSKKIEWNNLMVCMVQTLRNRIKNPQIANRIQTFPIVICDEADEVINRKDCRDIFNQLHNAPVRVALTGTALKSKNKISNQWLINFFGPVVHRTSNKQLVEWGHSAKPRINFIFGCQTKRFPDYQQEYQRNIIRHKKRTQKIWKIANKQLETKKGPVVIMVRYHEHINKLMQFCPDDMQENFSIKQVHGKMEMSLREHIINDFKRKKVDILITSMILRRGKNLKKIGTLINAAGGDSESNVLQIFGRALRKSEDEQKTYIYEFYDYGKYLPRHSKHRMKYYRNEGFEVKEGYKVPLKKAMNPDY